MSHAVRAGRLGAVLALVSLGVHVAHVDGTALGPVAMLALHVQLAAGPAAPHHGEHHAGHDGLLPRVALAVVVVQLALALAVLVRARSGPRSAVPTPAG